MSLPKIPNRSKTYYKITNKKEIHHGLQYQDGLMIDPIKFNNNPKASCVKGGIYFTTKGHLHKFFYFGEHIRPVTIPKDAQVVLDPGRDKYRADQLFFYPRQPIQFYFDKLFNKKTFSAIAYFILAQKYSKYFDKWFGKKTFPRGYYYLLAHYCPEHFNKWFDKNAFSKKDYYLLAKYCQKHFDTWFDKETYPKEYYSYLTTYCKEHHDKWKEK